MQLFPKVWSGFNPCSSVFPWVSKSSTTSLRNVEVYLMLPFLVRVYLTGHLTSCTYGVVIVSTGRKLQQPVVTSARNCFRLQPSVVVWLKLTFIDLWHTLKPLLLGCWHRHFYQALAISERVNRVASFPSLFAHFMASW